MVVVLLLAVVFAAVLVPPAVRAHQERRDAFLVSFGQPDGSALPPPLPRRSPQVERRREILSGLLVAIAGTGLIGLLPTFRALLVVHLFLIDAFLGYVAVLAHLGDRRGRRTPSAAVVGPAGSAVAGAGDLVEALPIRLARRREGAHRAIPNQHPPVAAAG